MQVNRPKEYRPELAQSSTPKSKDEQMRQQLGLGPEDGPGDEEEDAPPPLPAKKKSAPAKAAGSDAKVAELEAKNAELEQSLAKEATRRDEQVETIKKLANSRMANITKSFEEKLAARERELEELSATSANDAEQLAQMRAHASALEEQLKKAGVQPAAAPAPAGSDDRLLGEIERLRKENAALRSKPAGNATGNGAASPSAATDAENRELKKTIDNLMEANSKLVSNTKSKIALLESELEKYKAGGGGGGGGGGGSSGGALSAAASAQIAQMQKMIEEEGRERKKAVEESARLRRELESNSAAVQSQSGAAVEEMKKVKMQSAELTKQLEKKEREVKDVEQDFALKEKELRREMDGLREEKVGLQEAYACMFVWG